MCWVLWVLYSIRTAGSWLQAYLQNVCCLEVMVLLVVQGVGLQQHVAVGQQEVLCLWRLLFSPLAGAGTC